MKSDEQNGIDDFFPPGLFCYRVHRELVLVGGALTDGGSVVEWARALLNMKDEESFKTCLEQVAHEYEKSCTEAFAGVGTASSASNSITMVPFLSGERSIGFRGGAKGCISGLTRETTSTDIMHACLESVVLRLGCVLQLIKETCYLHSVEGTTSSRSILVASGNALERNTLWRQMLADCSSMDVIMDNDSREGSSRGAAVLMAASLNQVSIFRV